MNASLGRSPKIVAVAKASARILRKHQTPAEEEFWEIVRNKRFENLKFYRQHPLFFRSRGNESFYIADFYCRERRLVIEIDGEVHLKRKEEDSLRTQTLAEAGIRVVRFTNEKVILEKEKVVEVLKSHLL